MAKQPDEEDLMRLLMDSIKDNIYFKDLQGHFILINREGAKRAGTSPEQLIGKTDLDIFTDEHGLAAYEDEQRIMQTGIPLVGKEEKETREGGHDTWVSTSKMPLRKDSGEIVGTFGISRDITDRKNAELSAAKYAEQNRRLRDEMESDLRMAAELQKTFLPSTYPEFPKGASPADSAIRFCHHYHSAGSIGGDFCSVRKLSDTEAGILICDVMGHGVRAALVTALVRGIVEDISCRENDPGRCLEHMNKVLHPIMHQGDDHLVSTACYMILDCATGMLRCSIAGHPTPILLNAEKNKAEWLTEDASFTGPALAVDAATQYTTFERIIQPNDAMILFTDGLYEITNDQGNMYGKDRLMQLAHHHRSLPVRALLPRIIDEIRPFAAGGVFADDVCLVGCRLLRLLAD